MYAVSTENRVAEGIILAPNGNLRSDMLVNNRKYSRWSVMENGYLIAFHNKYTLYLIKVCIQSRTR